ncbi:mitochondrial ribonuclease P protein 1-like protein [Dinothrombium tinctorium]|uniref:RNA (guanine-9-)-methyltransferase domain-containing protein 1 n=1 Tax=Dinothrombium tinctorium TaxID=1965070 RepID=A0A3S3NKI6_9ACAR|nr:mitochondrial ribonuclease P protein 1-like protein [Dinothrombium tinctorium]
MIAASALRLITACNLNSFRFLTAVRTIGLATDGSETDGTDSSNETLDKKMYTSLITDENTARKLNEIIEHYELIKRWEHVPSTVSLKDMQKLLKIDDRTERDFFFHYLYVTECKKNAEKRRKQRRLENESKCEFEQKSGLFLSESGGYEYGLWRNSMFIKCYKNRLQAHALNKLYHASIFGQPLVFDFSFEKSMERQEIDSLSSQLMIINNVNKSAKWPFNIWFTNFDFGSYTYQRYNSIYGNSLVNRLINISPHSYLDLFPKEKLVYLSPDAESPLLEFDHNAIYIIGCIVDRIENQPFTFNKSQREGIKSYRLPLDEWLIWYKGEKDLTLNQVVEILLKAKETGSWRRAVKKVPSRKWTKRRKPEENQE